MSFHSCTNGQALTLGYLCNRVGGQGGAVLQIQAMFEASNSSNNRIVSVSVSDEISG